MGIEFITGDLDESGTKLGIVSKQEYDLIRNDGSKAWYRLETIPDEPGIFDYGIRLFPKNDLLGHRQDMGLVRWI